MKILVAIAPERYRDEELDEPLGIFRQHDICWDIASVQKGPCRGMLGGKSEATIGFSDIDPTSYAGLVIVGGGGSMTHLWGNRDLADLAKNFFTAKKIVAAICLSPVVLARAGILKGRRATVFPSPDAVAELKKGEAILSQLPVITDGIVITANGPEASRDFGKAIVAALNP